MLGLFIAEIFNMMETRRKREMTKRVLTRSVLRMTRDCPSSRAIIFRHGAPPGARRRVLFLSSPRRRSPAATAPSSSRRHRDAHDRRRRRRRAPPSTRVRQSPPRRVVRAMRVTPAHAGSRAITRARGGRGRSSESMTGTRRSEVRALRCTLHGAVPGARAWIACAAPGKVIALCVVANAPARHDRRENSRAEIRSVPARVSPSAPSLQREARARTSPSITRLARTSTRRARN